MKVSKAAPERMHFYDLELSQLDKMVVRRQERTDGLNQNMFNDDFVSIFRHSRHDSGNFFDLKSNNDKLSQRLLGNVKTRYSLGDVDETLTELVEEIVQSLIWYGKAIYFLHDDDEKNETHMVSYSSDVIFKIAGIRFQYLPNRVKKNWDSEDIKLGRELRLLDRRKLLHFQWPTPIHRKITLQNRFLSTLDNNDSSVLMKFQPQATHENPNPRNYFDFKKWQTAHDLGLYKATRETGWNARKHDVKKSDFFDCHRLIRFRKMQLNLRDDILTQLSIQLSKVGRHYWPNFKITISATEALSSITYLNELEARLRKEEVGFSEVIDYCYKP